MSLGIRPTVDFAFKRLLGSPEHTAITVHFLNAVLECTPRIERVEILNPILDPETDDDKLAVLDVLAIDEAGRHFNIEMQTSLPSGLSQRLVYYAGSLYVGQLGAGESYLSLRPAICICVLERSLLAETDELHSDFRLRAADGRTFSDELQIHLVELSKLRADEHNMKSVRPLERWAYFLRHADRYSAAELRDILSEAAFTEAIGVLEMIARNPEQRLAYDARLKFQRDEAARLEFARLEGERMGREQGEAVGREMGREEGREEGREVGREEGALIGKIQLLEELLSLPLSDDHSLAKLNPQELAARVESLQRMLRERTS
jgi:predicted transposase/invertase (TIGR01784 family)